MLCRRPHLQSLAPAHSHSTSSSLARSLAHSPSPPSAVPQSLHSLSLTHCRRAVVAAVVVVVVVVAVAVAVAVVRCCCSLSFVRSFVVRSLDELGATDGRRTNETNARAHVTLCGVGVDEPRRLPVLPARERSVRACVREVKWLSGPFVRGWRGDVVCGRRWMSMSTLQRSVGCDRRGCMTVRWCVGVVQLGWTRREGGGRVEQREANAPVLTRQCAVG